LSDGRTQARIDRRTLYGIAAIVAFGAVLRLPALLHGGLWRDDAYVYIDVTAPTFAEFLHRVIVTEWHPPLYFTLLYFWTKMAGTSELSLLILPYLCSLLAIPATYLLGAAAESKSVGLLAAAIYAVAPLPAAYSTEYVYPLCALLCTLLALLVTRARRREPSPTCLAAVALTSFLLAFTHYLALLYVPLLAAWALTSPVGLKKGAAVAASAIAGMLPFAAWAPVLLRQLSIGVPFAGSVKALKALTLLNWLLESMPARPLVLEFAFLALVAFAVVVVAFHKRFVFADSLALGSIYLLVLGIMLAGNLPYVRYAMPLYALLATGLAYVVLAFADRIRAQDPAAASRWGPALTAVAAALFIAGDARDAFGGQLPKSGIRSFVSSAGIDPRTLYVIAPDEMTPTFAYYTRHDEAHFMGFVRRNNSQVFVLEGYERDWNDPHAVRDALQAIAAAKQFRYVELVVDERTHGSPAVPFWKSWQLLAQLERRYSLVKRARYPGEFESVAVYRFVL
jgi:hypothetical protein